MSNRSPGIQMRGTLYGVAALVGIAAGLIGGAFHAVLDAAEQGRALLRVALTDAPVPGWMVLMALGALILSVAMWLVRRFAPETAGSGIQEVEAILAGQRTLRWRRVLPVKFVAGALAVGSGLVLGREGPTVHMGSALGKMASDWARLSAFQTRVLISAGAAAGLAAAFNAPLAAIVFVTEELREQFEYGFASLQSVILACCMAVIVSDWFLGQGPSLPMHHLASPSLFSLPLFLVLGLLVGAFGVFFNGLLLDRGVVQPRLPGQELSLEPEVSAAAAVLVESDPIKSIIPSSSPLVYGAVSESETQSHARLDQSEQMELSGAEEDSGLPPRPPQATSVEHTQLQSVTPDAAEVVVDDAAAIAPDSPGLDGPHYGIQLISFRSRASLGPFAEKHDILDQATVLTDQHRGQNWYALLVGDYATRAQAQLALSKMPLSLRQLKPMIRTMPEPERLEPLRQSR